MTLMNREREIMQAAMAPLVGGSIISVRKHRLTVDCLDGVTRVCGLQSDSEGNAAADIYGAIPQKKGSPHNSLSGLVGAVITGVDVVADDYDPFLSFPHIDFELNGFKQDLFLEAIGDTGGGYAHVWEKNERAPICAL